VTVDTARRTVGPRFLLDGDRWIAVTRMGRDADELDHCSHRINPPLDPMVKMFDPRECDCLMSRNALTTLEAR
jgi:hypothetical protein